MLAGVAVHAIQRGNNRGSCFVSDADRSFYLFHLARALDRFDCDLHAYCLMTNHVHLLLTPKEADGCGSLMKHVGQVHSQYVNRTYARTGSLWEGRYRSCLVQSETYLLACYRYIELNPVRAGLVQHPRDYPWSSYRLNAESAQPGMITPHDEYVRLGVTQDGRQLAYAQMVAAGMQDVQVAEIRLSTNGGHALGDDRFRRAMAATPRP
ncbi:MAG TPA: transposase [Burkholderiales bacterium]|nr:transposase [Burkholderiales bacterium]